MPERVKTDADGEPLLRDVLPSSVLPVAGATTIGGVKRNPGVAGQYITGFDTDGNAQYDEPASLVYRPGWNLLRNGNCAVQQRGVLFDSTGGRNNDGAYTYDGWYILSDGNNVIGIDGGKLKAEIKTANKKFGLTQILEFQDTAAVREFSVTFSFSAVWLIGAVTHVKAAILGWTGTADAPTHDFISSWNGNDTLPTLAANWEYLNTPANLNVTNDGTYYSVSASPNSTHRNLAVFVWSDATSSTIGRILSLDEMQLEMGGSRTSFQYVPYVDNLARCQRHYEVIRYDSAGQGLVSNFYFGTQHVHTWYYRATKFKTPTVSLVTGSWTGGTPTITPSADTCYFTRAAGSFVASGTYGNVALAASAEL